MDNATTYDGQFKNDSLWNLLPNLSAACPCRGLCLCYFSDIALYYKDFVRPELIRRNNEGLH